MGFKAPALQQIAIGRKRYDVRDAEDPDTKDIATGDVINGAGAGVHYRMRVTSIRTFSSVQLAYDYYLAKEQAEFIFPFPAYDSQGAQVATAADAAALYERIIKGARSAKSNAVPCRAVRVFAVAPTAAPLPMPLDEPNLRPVDAHRNIIIDDEFTLPPFSKRLPRARRFRDFTLPPFSRRLPRVHTIPSFDELPTRPSVTPAKMPYTPLSALAAAAVNEATQSDLHAAEKLTSAARYQARVRGASIVAPSDVIRAAHPASSRSRPSPASELPSHYDDILAELEHIRSALSAFSGGEQHLRPKVLIVGETSGVVASMMKRAGADVATCDLQPTETPNIPHFQGDAAYIQDLGWDMVIGHPPCTYLANSGVNWIHEDPERWNDVLANAAVFRSMRAADAPFVAIENSKMHRYGRALVGGQGPNQYVHPWQHGTGHTKPTGLHLRNLPPLKPTCIVEGREAALAALPPTPDRSTKRSRTYLGVAGAMASQWMPVVIDHVLRHRSRTIYSAEELVSFAATATPTRQGIVAFTRRTRSGLETLSCDGAPFAFDLDDDTTPAGTATRWIAQRLLLPLNWRTAVSQALRAYPQGHHSLHEKTGGDKVTLSHVWTLDVTDLDSGSNLLPVPLTPTDSGAASPVQWTPAGIINCSPALRWAMGKGNPHVIADSAIERPPRPPKPGAFDGVVAAAVTPEPITRPWLVDYHDLPPPAPTPRHVRRLHGRWRMWRTDGDGRYGWHELHPELQHGLELSGQLPASHLPSIDEMASPAYAASEGALCAAAFCAPTHAGLSADRIRRLWVQQPRLPKEKYLGLGATLASSQNSTLAEPQSSQVERSEFYRSQHQSWVSSSKTVAAVIPLASTEEIEINPEDIQDTPRVPHQMRPDSLFIQNLVVLRESQKTKDKGNRFYITVAAVVNRALADTGAGPSLVTTELLEQLPPDCCVCRNADAAVTPTNGADGLPLRMQGTVSIMFSLDNKPYSHTFVVAVGAPLLLLGMDFLAKWRATISIESDGKGIISLNRPNALNKRNGSSAGKHSFRVATAAPPSFVSTTAAAISKHSLFRKAKSTPQPVTATAAAAISTHSLPTPTLPNAVTKDGAEQGQARDPRGQASRDASSPEVENASDLVNRALKEGSWRLESTEHLLYSHKPIKLPPRSRVVVRVNAPHALAHNSDATCLVDRLPNRAGLEDPPQVMPRCTRIDNGQIELEIWNTRRTAHTVAANLPLAKLDTEYYVHHAPADNEDSVASEEDCPISKLTATELKLLAAVSIDPDNVLTEAQRLRVRQLVAKHITAFASDPKDPSKTHLMEVELPLKPGAYPHTHSASKLGEKGRGIVEAHVQEMESRGIIRKSNSAWGSRVVLVTKKDGSIRFCVDYRDLNSKLQTQDSPIPLTVDALDRLASGKGPISSLFLSTLDLASGFWCLPVKEEDKGLTAFVTQRQKYEFNYLPFGIQSGPSYMCRLMDAALQGLAWESCMPYLDDVGIWATGEGATEEERQEKSFEQMMERLEAVFERLKWAGLSMKASKCVLFATKAEYLGHIMSRDGLRMDPKKIAAVALVDPVSINSLVKVRSFLGLCSYYRRFIKGFSQIAAPLHNLTKEGMDVAALSQTAECQEAIKKLIVAITSEPVLTPPRFDRQFIVKTDAANTEGLGGLLVQKNDEGKEQVVAYFGRRLNKHERNYTVTEIELLAAVEAIKQWRPYLWGREFKLIVDHAALKWLHSMRDTMEGGPASRLMRWILKLSEYNFTVEHKPGAQHNDADGVSRIVAPAYADGVTNTVAPVLTARRRLAALRDDSTRDEIIQSYLNTGAPSYSVIRDAQKEDPACHAIVKLTEGALDEAPASRAALQALNGRSANARIKVETHKSHVDNKGERIIESETRYENAYVILDDIVYRRTGPDRKKLVAYVPESLRLPLIASYHDHLGHPSADRTHNLLRERYYWPRMQKEVHVYVGACHECTLAKPVPQPHSAIGPAVGRYSFDKLYCDILDMADTHDYDAAAKTGARKLIIFVDSLSRWVEAIPLHSDPTSEQVLDIFMEHVVARYGVPRHVATDAGSNLASRLVKVIMDSTGVDLSEGAANHHQAVGTVERFNQTLQYMTRAANEGGGHWRDHLPFLLMSYRATPNRITGQSPALLLYGRELRLPSQLSDPLPPDSVLAQDDDVQSYARDLSNKLVYAWRAAHDATRAAQGSSIGDTVRTSPAVPVFKVNDLVGRKLYGHSNKLDYVYAGPYRILSVEGNGRYTLRDLENGMIKKDMDVSNLRPYRADIGGAPLAEDEYVVEALLKGKRVKGNLKYLVKWRGYDRKQATWEPRSGLMGRCDDMVLEYERLHLPRPEPKPKRKASRRTPTPEPEPVAVEPSAASSEAAESAAEPPEEEQRAPNAARFQRGAWEYQCTITTPRGVRVRFFPASSFTNAQLDSPRFEALRQGATTTVACVLSSAAFLAHNPHQRREKGNNHIPLHSTALELGTANNGSGKRTPFSQAFRCLSVKEEDKGLTALVQTALIPFSQTALILAHYRQGPSLPTEVADKIDQHAKWLWEISLAEELEAKAIRTLLAEMRDFALKCQHRAHTAEERVRLLPWGHSSPRAHRFQRRQYERCTRDAVHWRKMATDWYWNFNVLSNELDDDDHGLERHLHGDRLQPSRHPEPIVIPAPSGSAIWAMVLAGQRRRAIAAGKLSYSDS